MTGRPEGFSRKFAAMQNQPTKTEILRAVRARFELDSGLGVDFAPAKGWDASSLEQALAEAKEPAAPAPARPPAPPPAREAPPPERIPPAAARPAIPVRQAPPPSGGPPPRPAAQFHSSLVPPAEAPASPAKEAALSALREEALRCRACELCAKRNSVVWGEGNLDARVMFIGEAPGRDEDLEGRPFVGRSGRLLTDIIEKGMKLPRQMVYIANVVKCRPPGNRDPKPEEVSACYRYLKKQIETIAPKVIVAVGGVSGCFLLNLPPKSPGLRGRWHQYEGIPLRVIFHPSYLLRQRGASQTGGPTSADRETWRDVQEIMNRLQEA